MANTFYTLVGASFPYTFPITFGGAIAAFTVEESFPVWPIEYHHWMESVFFQMEPGDQINPVYFEAWQNLSTALMPNVSSEELFGEAHLYPYSFGGTIEPSNYISPPASWQNQSTWLMPEVYERELYGLYATGESGGSWAVMQLSTPTFLPDGTAVTPPTGTKPSPGTGTGRTRTERV